VPKISVAIKRNEKSFGKNQKFSKPEEVKIIFGEPLKLITGLVLFLKKNKIKTMKFFIKQ